ncbi:MAG: hypothetical protein ACKE8G_04575 [Methylophagaceae bacterium]
MQTDNNKIRALALLIIYAVVINILVFYSPITFFSPPKVTTINNVQFNASDVNSLESVDNTNWQTVVLPDSWYENHSQIDQVWYRVEINLDKVMDEPWGVYLPSVTHNAAVYINDVWVGQGGAFSEPVSRHQNEPLLFNFSSKLLQQGRNKIDIKVKTAFWEQGLLDQFYIAPVKQLQPAYSWKYFIRVNVIQWLTIAMFIMAAIALAFWIARPQDTLYGFFSLELLFWASHNLNLVIHNIPVSSRLWEAMTMSTLGWMTIAMIFFTHRYIGKVNIRIEKSILIYAVLGLGLLFLPDISSIHYFGYTIWDACLIVLGFYAMYILLASYWKTSNQGIYLMLLIGTLILVCGWHDILLVNHYINSSDGLIIQYSAIPALIFFSWVIVKRFVQAINKAEMLAATLEQRVQNKQQALQLQYEQLQTLEKQQVLASERERIMRDIHDGIGGQLISIIGLLQEKQGTVFVKVREKVQSSLTDLRFVIDSLDPVLSDLSTLLGMMRMRLVDQLEAANVELEWAVTELPILKEMSPSRSLHIMRIVQEAITNSIKHSGSKEMKLATGILAETQQVFIDVIDYGKGFEQNKVMSSNSRGIKNMYYRADQLGAKLDIRSDENNTRVRLLLSY